MDIIASQIYRNEYGLRPVTVHVAEVVQQPVESGHSYPGVIEAPVPESLVPRCLADESLLAHVSVAKFGDHLPAYRLDGILNDPASPFLVKHFAVGCKS